MRGSGINPIVASLAATLFVSVSVARAAEPPLTFVLHTSGIGANGAWVSADGSVVAGYIGGAYQDKRPVYWIGGQPADSFVEIPFPNDPNAIMARTTAMSGNGKVIGGYYGPGDYPPDYARIWVHNVATNTTTRITNPSNPTIGANDAQITGINYDGSVIVGTVNHITGWRRTGNVMQTLPAAANFPAAVSPDGNIVVGGLGSSGFIWRTSGQITNLPFAATTLTADGSIVAGTIPLPIPMPNGGTLISDKAVLWNNGVTTELGDLPGGVYRSIVNDLSADGSIAVGTSDAGNTFDAFIWDAAHGIRSLQSMVADAGYDLTGLRLTNAISISDDGLTIAGNGLDVAHSNLGFTWVINPVTGPVPEPSSAIVLLMLGALGACSRRRNKSRQ